VKPSLRLILSATLLLLSVAGPASAQYMKITSDNPSDPTRLRSSGSTLLTITLDTNHDKDGSLQTCNSHTAANCPGASTTSQPLNMFSYTLAFKAAGGTVSWGTFTPADEAYTTIIPQAQSDREVEINMARPVGTVTDPGLSTIGTIPITVVSGSPTIGLQIGPGALNPFGFGTGFGTFCDGFFFANTYVAGDPSDPCGNATGVAGDWFDFDGVTAGPSGTQPQIAAPPNAVAAEGTPMTPIEATATDADASATLTITQSGKPADLTFTTDPPGPSPRHASVSGTPGFDDANVPDAGLGFYRIAFTVSDGGFGVATAVTALVISNTNRTPILNPIPDTTLCDGAVVDVGISGSDPDGDALVFSKVAGSPFFMTVTTTGPTTGNIHLAPPVSTPSGTFTATVRADDGGFQGTADRSFTITIPICDRAPTLNQPANMTVTQGATADQTITGTDPFGAALTFSKVSGPTLVTVTTTNPTTGNIHLAPGAGDLGTYAVTVQASDGTLNNQKQLVVTVQGSGNQCPTANPGAYIGVVGVPVDFDGSGSSDPDGNPLSYAWDFDASNGIQVDAVGVTASHTYTLTGLYRVTLTVTDNGNGDASRVCSDRQETPVNVLQACPAAVFNGYDTIRLNSGKPFWFAFVESASGCYTNSDVIVPSFVMKYAGRQISASGKSSVGVDKNGIPAIRVTFSKDDLRTLFSGTGLSNGHNTVVVELEADLTNGGRLAGSAQLDVVNNGSFTAATVSPNPLNPEATLTFATTRQGAVRIDLFNIQGRLVRRLVDESALAAGIHNVTIDGRGSRGEKLPSGVYYIRGVSAEGEFKQLITILK